MKTMEDKLKEYFQSKGSVIGICELCKNFNYCLNKGELKDGGCDNHTYMNED